MGWWDSLWGSDTSADDPLRKLDPKLREFLEKESPVKFNNNNNKTTTENAQSQSQQQIKPSSESTTIPRPTEEQDASKPIVPRESQFQDGRYAHLWKSYRPLGEIEAETKSDHEKLMDVLEGFKDRKAQIGRAALENCALEQVDWRGCMTNPSMSERLTLCRDQVRKFERCYMTQTRLLKALGYLSSLDGNPQMEEDIQMHADALYHRMLAQEEEAEAAKKEGRPIPKFTPIVPKPMITTTTTTTNISTTGSEELTPEQQETLKQRLEKVGEEDRAAETEAYKAEMRAKAEFAEKVQGLWRQQDRERQIRKEKGEETMWDRVAGVFKSDEGNANANNSNTSSGNTSSGNNGQEKK
ncbi:hypothetical protein F4808DRAFT_438419 [Astrocystis sublimbata]|nr:hypothetical protein F4808DRAFT_438419 [Astrocystis sublimbata]